MDQVMPVPVPLARPRSPVLAGPGCPPDVTAILQRNNQRLFRIARSVLKDPAEAEEAVQDAYVRALSNLDGLREQASLGAWLARITLNEALGRLRRRRVSVPLAEIAENIPDDTAAATVLLSPFGRRNPEQATMRREVREILERAVDALPTHFRIVFVACDIEKMPIAEAADLLGLYQVTVKTRLFRARRLLRRNLDADLIDALAAAFPCAGRRCERIAEAVLARIPRSALLRAPCDPGPEGELP